MRDEARRIRRSIEDLVGTGRGDDVVSAAAREGLALMNASSEVGCDVVVDDRWRAVADGLELVFAAGRAAPRGAGDGHRHDLCFELLLGCRVVAPALLGDLRVGRPLLADLATHRRHLLALATEDLPSELGELLLEVLDTSRPLDGLLPKGAVVFVARDQDGALTTAFGACPSIRVGDRFDRVFCLDLR